MIPSNRPGAFGHRHIPGECRDMQKLSQGQDFLEQNQAVSIPRGRSVSRAHPLQLEHSCAWSLRRDVVGSGLVSLPRCNGLFLGRMPTNDLGAQLLKGPGRIVEVEQTSNEAENPTELTCMTEGLEHLA
jgi:hypothetical protein